MLGQNMQPGTGCTLTSENASQLSSLPLLSIIQNYD